MLDKNDRTKREEELDHFWDLNRIVPKKVKPKYTSMKSDSDTLAEIIVPARQESSRTIDISDSPLTIKEEDIKSQSNNSANKTQSNTENVEENSAASKDRKYNYCKSTVIKRYIPPYTAEKEESKQIPAYEYRPDNSLIHSVQVFDCKQNNIGYDNFNKSAHIFHEKESSVACDYVPFFSYVPQYVHLTREQIRWYIYWRTCTLKNEYIATGYSYVMLYAYELIVLSDVVEPQILRQRLCDLWLAYREAMPRLDLFICEWLCDFSLIHRLPPPDVSSEAFEEIMLNCTLKEYFIPCRGNEYKAYADVIAKYCSSYNFHKSKFCTGENVILYEKHITAALEYAMKKYSDSSRIFSAIGLTDSHMVKETFSGVPCGFNIKKKLEIDYCSFSRTNDLRYTVGDIIKYCENKLREYLGIKSRFGAVALHIGVRNALDEYFALYLGSPRVIEKKKKDQTEFDSEVSRLYDIPKSEFSADKAKAIESASWQTTELLTSAFAGDDESASPYDSDKGANEVQANDKVVYEIEVPAVAEDSETSGNTEINTKELTLADMSEQLRRFMILAFNKDFDGQNKYAAKCGFMVDAMADKVNEAALDIIGDIILDYENGGYTVIPDYANLLADLDTD